MTNAIENRKNRAQRRPKSAPRGAKEVPKGSGGHWTKVNGGTLWALFLPKGSKILGKKALSLQGLKA